MQRIEKKHLRKVNCPKCARPKLRFEHSVDGVAPDGAAPQRLRCDQCKVQFLESDAAIQRDLSEIITRVTPIPVSSQR
jgi:transposase-like protein